jgi:hypothetical protein
MYCISQRYNIPFIDLKGYKNIVRRSGKHDSGEELKPFLMQSSIKIRTVTCNKITDWVRLQHLDCDMLSKDMIKTNLLVKLFQHFIECFLSHSGRNCPSIKVSLPSSQVK